MEFPSGSIQEAVNVIRQNYLSNNTDRPYHHQRESIIYFDGWKGLGASVVFAAIAESARSAGSKFDIVIHVDCSVWKSRREMQRIIAEELKIDASALFDKHDEDDDFSGIDKSSRSEIADVAEFIFQAVKDRSCLMILHNGSDHEIDLVLSGVPVLDWRNKVLWTFQGRFRLDQVTRCRVKSAHIFLSARTSRGTSLPLGSNRELLDLLHKEAAQVTHDVNPAVTTDCWFYLLLWHYMHDSPIDYDRDNHASNHWVCDGIISGDSAWEISERLHEGMRKIYLSTGDKLYPPGIFRKMTRWISTISESAKVQNIQSIPKETTSYFLTLEKSDHPATLPKHLFVQSIKLRVLRLSWCGFSFTSPTFIWCNNLRFIFIDSCSDEDVKYIGNGDDKKDTKWAFLQTLWVLDIRRTRWDWILSPSKMVLMIELRELNLIDAGASWSNWGMAKLEMKWLCDLRRLRIINSSTFLRALVEDSFRDMHKLELLDLSGNIAMKDLPNLSAASELKVLILDGCDGLRNVEPGVISTSLESFSFDGFGRASNWKNSLQIPEKEVRPSSRDNKELPLVSKISLEGCARLKNVFLRGLPNLEELNLSKTAIQALDLEAMQARQLERLFLIECENLRRVQWLDAKNPPLKLLFVDTRGMAGRSMDGDCQKSHSYSQLQDFTHVVASDARFCRGFGVYGSNFHLHVSSTFSSRQLSGSTETRKNCGSSDELDVVLVVGSPCPYSDVLDKVSQEDNGDELSNQTCTHLLPSERHIEFANGYCNWESKSGHERMVSLMNEAQSLHVHDNSSITAANLEFEEDTQFTNLRWCRIERCPNLHSAFLVDAEWMSGSSFKSLETFWASHLLGARCIWNRKLSFENVNYKPPGTRRTKYDFMRIFANKGKTTPDAFSQLRYIHPHSCPRLGFVLPWSFPILASLETIQITYCGELRQIFPKGETYTQKLATEIEFPNLRNIHLHELPMLQLICETNMSAPMLETIRLRGCWSLRQLPAIHASRPQDKPPAVVDCEKDWWDKLQWDGLEASRSLFSPRHSRYYRKTIPRGSLLR